MAAIWTLENQYNTWLEVELAVVEAQAEMGLIPQAEAKQIIDKAGFDSLRIAEIEKIVKHDVIAFVTAVEEKVGPAARFFHFGLTSSDVLDTSLSLRLVRAAAIIREDLTNLIAALGRKAGQFKDCPVIGRSHGIHAEPTTFGHKLLSFFTEFQRNLVRLDRAIEEVSVGQISGPVGNFSARSLSPALEERALSKLKLRAIAVSSQVISRDVHAAFFLTLALIASSVERLATEIRLLARTEVSEVEEAFGQYQKGSSAMPHKKNPILSENLTGLARLVRSYAQASLENVVLWHERDISHSSVERVIAPDSTELIDFMLHRLASLVDNLVVKPEKMLKNLALTRGLYNSQELLLALCQKGLARTEAYGLIQAKAMAAAKGEGDFRTLIESDPTLLSILNKDVLDDIFDSRRFNRYIGQIFQRAGLKS
jgi:adenylosuccinate lyase